jgi:cytochrome c553
MYYKTTAFIFSALILFSGCSESKREQTADVKTKEPVQIEQKAEAQVIAQEEVVVKKDYTIEEIYNSMCIECHSADGTGNTEKLTPSMATLTEQEMIIALKDIEADQGHIIMEHNRGEIIKMGMEYAAEDMAAYMHKRFNTVSE